MVRIVDSSVAVKWFVPEPGRSKALKVLQEVLQSPEDFAVPELFYFELAHTLFKLLAPFPQQHADLLDQLLLFGIKRFSMTPELAGEVRVFQALGLSGYDAAYVALAKLTKGKWITFDEKAHKLVSHLGLSQVL